MNPVYYKIGSSNRGALFEKILHKPFARGSALATLKSIEKIFNMKVASYHNLFELQKMSIEVRDRYLEKSKRISRIRRFFGRIAIREKQIQTICERICSKYERVQVRGKDRFSKLPEEINLKISQFLGVEDLGRLAQSSKEVRLSVGNCMIARANNYGYDGIDLGEAKQYILDLSRGLSEASKRERFHKEWIIYRPSMIQQQPRIHFERTLANVRQFYLDASQAEKMTFKVKFSLKSCNEFELKVYFFVTTLLNSIWSVCQRGQIRMLESYLQSGIDPTLLNSEGQSPLGLAAFWGQKKIVDRLLADERVNANQYGYYNYTPLSLACYGGHKEVVDLLLQNGADQLIPDHEGVGPLHIAVVNGFIEIIEKSLLPDSKGELAKNMQAFDGRTPYNYAALAYRVGQASSISLFGDPLSDEQRTLLEARQRIVTLLNP